MRNKKKQIQQTVSELLEQFKIKQPPVSVEKIARNLNIKVVFENFEDQLSGFLASDNNFKVIGVNASHSAVRQRFTIAHEIGHFKLHDANQVFVDKGFAVHLRDSNPSHAASKEEIEANQFAGELLMPTDFIYRDLQDMQIETLDMNDSGQIDKLAKRYHVSTQALIIRLVNLGVLRGLH